MGEPAESRLPRFCGHDYGRSCSTGERFVLPSGRETTVTRIVTANGDLDQAVANQSITLTLADEVDISRGDLLCRLLRRLKSRTRWNDDCVDGRATDVAWS